MLIRRWFPTSITRASNLYANGLLMGNVLGASLSPFISQVIGWLFIATALPRLPAVETSVLLLVQPVFAIAWGIMFFAERQSLVQWIGSAIVLAGVTVLSINLAGSSPEPHASSA